MLEEIIISIILIVVFSIILAIANAPNRNSQMIRQFKSDDDAIAYLESKLKIK